MKKENQVPFCLLRRRRGAVVVQRLKTLPAFYNAVLIGEKTFEVRYNDRDYRVGDVLILREWTGRGYTGENIVVRVSYILSAPEFGTQPGWSVLGFKKGVL